MSQKQGISCSTGIEVQEYMTDTMGGEGGEEWNGGLAGEHVRRENAIHTQTRGVCVYVCMYVCVSEQKGKPSFSTAGGLGDRMAIHSQRGKPSCSTGCTVGMHKTGAVGEGMPQKQRDILSHRAKPKGAPQGAGRMHHDVHYLLKYKST